MLIDDAAIQRILERSQRMPSHAALQPTNYFVVSRKEIKEGLWRACLKQSLLLEAPFVVVFTGDRYIAKHRFETQLDQDLESGYITTSQAESREHEVSMHFDTSPAGFGWLGKCIAAPFLRLITPMAQLSCIHKREWLCKQVMRNAALFCYFAKQEGFGAEFIDTYDELRVKLALNIPWYHVVVAIVPVGFPKEREIQKNIVPLDEVVHWNK